MTTNSTGPEPQFLTLNQFQTLIPEIYELDLAQIKQCWIQRQWEDIRLSWENYRVLVTMDREIISSFALWHIADFHCAHLLKIATNPSYVRTGIAERLLNKSIQRFRQGGYQDCYLEVSVDNVQAIALYEKLSFKIIHTKKAFYTDGTNAYAMQLILN